MTINFQFILKAKVDMGKNLMHSLCCMSVENYNLQPDIVDLLVEAGVSAVATDDDLCTPLHYACKNHNK